MKKLGISLFPLLILCVVILCGCGEQGSAAEGFPSHCFFDRTCPVVLIKNSPNNTDVVKLHIEGGGDARLPEVSWDQEIVDYDIETGRIVAREVGKTSLVALYSTQMGSRDYSLVEVLVENAQFAVQVLLEKRYDFKLVNGQDCSAVVVPRIGTAGISYNLDIDFQSSDKSIFTVDSTGNIIPTGTGVAELSVRAVSGYDVSTESCEYMYAYATIEIAELSECLLEVVDKNLQPVRLEDGKYNLFYGINSEDEDKYYYLKANTEAELLNGSVMKDESAYLLVSDNLSIAEGLDCILAESGRVKYIPIRVRGTGTGSLSMVIQESGHNGTFEIVSNEIYFNPYEFISRVDVRVNVPSEGGEYILYLPRGDAEEYEKAHSAGKYNYALIDVDILDSNCYNSFSVKSMDSEILDVERQGSTGFKVTVRGIGGVQVIISAEDGGGFSRILDFQIKAIDVESCSFYPDEEITLILGTSPSVNLAAQDIAPSYATYSYRLEYLGNEPALISIATDGTVTALFAGYCRVQVSLGSWHKVYNIRVRSPAPDIAPLEQTEFNVAVDDIVSIEFTDSNNQPITSGKLEWEIIASEGDINNFYFEQLCGTLTVYCLASGMVQFELQLWESSTLIHTSETITIRCG